MNSVKVITSRLRCFRYKLRGDDSDDDSSTDEEIEIPASRKTEKDRPTTSHAKHIVGSVSKYSYKCSFIQCNSWLYKMSLLATYLASPNICPPSQNQVCIK